MLRIKETLEEDPTSDELKEKYDKVLSDTISNVSAKGISIGFSAGILTLFVSLIPVTMRNGDTTSLRWAVGSSAIWWALFTPLQFGFLLRIGNFINRFPKSLIRRKVGLSLEKC